MKSLIGSAITDLTGFRMAASWVGLGEHDRLIG